MDWIIEGLTKSYGWTKSNDTFAYCKYDNYLFSICVKKRFKKKVELVFNSFTSDKLKLKKLEKFIINNKKKLKYTQYKISNSEVKLIFIPSHYRIINDSATYISTKLRNELFSEDSFCYICNKALTFNNISIYKTSSSVVYSHKTCLKNSNLNIKKCNSSKSYSFFTIFIAIFLSMILGFLLSINSIPPSTLFLVSCLISFIISLVYRLTINNINTDSIFFVPLTSFFSVFFSKYFAITFLLIKINNFSISNLFEGIHLIDNYSVFIILFSFISLITSLYFTMNIIKNNIHHTKI